MSAKMSKTACCAYFKQQNTMSIEQSELVGSEPGIVADVRIGIIHIDEIDKLARRGGSDFGSWGGGRDVGGEGVQQALLRLLEGTNVTLSAKPPPISSSTASPSSSSSASSSTTSPSSGTTPGGGTKAESASASTSGFEPPNWDPNNPMNRSFGAGPGGKKGVREGLPGFSGGGGGSSGGKGETFVVDTSNILFILSGAFVGLESIVQRRLGKGVRPFHIHPIGADNLVDRFRRTAPQTHKPRAPRTRSNPLKRPDIPRFTAIRFNPRIPRSSPDPINPPSIVQ
jgi:hypothetical protein